jgi:hypothetical protein
VEYEISSCTNSIFGDPLKGARKACFCENVDEEDLVVVLPVVEPSPVEPGYDEELRDFIAPYDID